MISYLEKKKGYDILKKKKQLATRPLSQSKISSLNTDHFTYNTKRPARNN